MTGPVVILCLKGAVIAASLILTAALIALALGKTRLHGRINLVFFAAVAATLVLFEVVVRLTHPGIFEYIQQNEELNGALRVHLRFAVPSALLLPLMLWTGYTRKKVAHRILAVVFAIAWAGTAYTGIFHLPHQ